MRLLPLRAPYDADTMLAFLGTRALGALEAVDGTRYRRRLPGGAWLEAQLAADGVRVSIPDAAAGCADALCARLRRLFDLDADPATIDAVLSTVPRLAREIAAAPGIRVPGCWDAFEGAVRAILGQQVSVSRAKVLAERLCARFGEGGFPPPEALAEADVAAIGIPGVRGRAVSALAQRACTDGTRWLLDAEQVRDACAAIRGLGPWTAEYMAMRISRDADAFPDADWGVYRALGVRGRAAVEWAQACRPWRAYATMYLWRSGSS